MSDILTSLHGNLIGLDKDANLVLPKAMKIQIGGTDPIFGVSPAGIGVVAEEHTAFHKRSTIRLTNLTVPLVDAAGVVAYLSQKLYDFPEGNILILGAVENLVVTKTSAGVNNTWSGTTAIGTVAANNNATLTTTEQDIIPSTATGAAVAGVGNAKAVSTSSPTFDGTTTAKQAFLNYLVNDADHDVTTTPCSLIFNGTVTITWVFLGDK